MMNIKKTKIYLIPVLIYLAFIAVYTGISDYRNNQYLFMPVWDVKHYLDISESGYDVYPCTPGIDGRAGDICGNSGWYPMWPLVVKLFRPLLGGSSKYTFVGLTFAFTLISFILFFHFIFRRYDLIAAIVSLLALVMGPASFYLLTGFPYALFMLLLMIYLLLLYAPAGAARNIFLFLTAMALSLTYPTGILIAVVPLVWYLAESRRFAMPDKKISYWLRLAAYIIPFGLGLFLLWTYFYFKFDDFFLQLHFQAKYDRTWAFPVWIMLKSLVKTPILSPENLVIIWYGLAFLLFIPYRMKKELWIVALVLYLFSLTTGTTLSIYRHYLIIFPIYMIVGTSAKPLWLKAAFIALGMIISLKVLFPLFMAYRLI
ncbi:MAG: hypothetical protein AB1746_13955 [Candidatus Zixiibacteriota bacterium]